MIERKIIDEVYSVLDKAIFVRREDLAYPSEYPTSGKIPALVDIVLEIETRDINGVAMFAKPVTNYAKALPMLLDALGSKKKALIFFAANSINAVPAWVHEAQALGAVVQLLRPNLITINANQARKLAKEQGYAFIPFGLDCQTAVNAFAKTLVMPPDTGTVLLSSCSGITLAGMIRGYRQKKRKMPQIIAVSCGRSAKEIKASIEKYEKLPVQVTIVDDYKAHEHFAWSSLWPVHAEYEAKTYDYMLKALIRGLTGPIRFLNLGL